MDKAAQVQRIIDRFEKPEDRDLLMKKLGRVLTRQKAIARFPTPGHLAQAWRPEFIQTPMLDKIDNAIIQAEAGLQRRWIINTPPQRGKTSRMQDAMAWMLLRNPGLNIGFCSYEQGIAAQSSLAIRQFIETHGSGYRGERPNPHREDMLGLLLDPDRAMQTRWSLADTVDGTGHKPGGVLAAGIGGAITGRPLDVLVIDDPIKDAKQADSVVYRRGVRNWFQSAALTRLSKHGIVIVVQTRWHEEDLTGWLLDNDLDNEWAHLNVPAQAKENDPLGRKPGEYLVDTRGFEAPDWERVKREVGERTWFALYQGEPSPPEGGVFKRAWFDRHRVPQAPELRLVETFVDPADNTGEGDEAGICTAGLDNEGHIYLLADDSGHYTVSQWFRAALFALLRHGGVRLRYEKSLSGLERSMKAEWRTIRVQARELRDTCTQENWPSEPDGEALQTVAGKLSDKDDDWGTLQDLERQLRDLWPFVPQVLELPHSGPTIRGVQARGSKTYRAITASALWENGTTRHVGHFPTLENQMATWMESQDSPDRMDAAVHLATVLTSLGVGDSTVSRARTGTNRAASIPTRSVRGRR